MTRIRINVLFVHCSHSSTISEDFGGVSPRSLRTVVVATKYCTICVMWCDVLCTCCLTIVSWAPSGSCGSLRNWCLGSLHTVFSNYLFLYTLCWHRWRAVCSRAAPNGYVHVVVDLSNHVATHAAQSDYTQHQVRTQSGSRTRTFKSEK